MRIIFQTNSIKRREDAATRGTRPVRDREGSQRAPLENRSFLTGRAYASNGASLIDVLVSLGIVGMLFTAVYMVYFSLVDSANNIEARTAASDVLSQQVEIIRNMPYEKVGTASGTPAGSIPQTQSVSYGNYVFSLKTTIRNIDDPYDGIIGGSPNDTAPADYKLVELEISCQTCARFNPLTFTTTVAPENLESATTAGSLFVTVLDANGQGVPEATVRIVNASVTPTIDLTDTANNGGALQLIGIPTSTQSYQVFVSKSGYSSAESYPPGGAGNPNPSVANFTVSAGAVSPASFQIDRTSMFSVFTTDNRCNAIPSRPFAITGAKIIGTSPTVYKFSTSSATGATGAKTFSSVEWDSYTVAMSTSGYDIAGITPFSALSVAPSSSAEMRFALSTSSPNALLVEVSDKASRAQIPGATVTISKNGFSETRITGRASESDTTWSGGGYGSKSPSADVDTVPGSISLLMNASSAYPTSTEYLVSRTIDMGSSTASLYSLSWTPVSQPAQTGSQSVKFQIAANNDAATWNFAGPDGTAGTYYTSPSTLTGFGNKRYARYKAFLSTQDEGYTPRIDDVILEFSGACIPPSHALFTGLSAGIYTIDVTAPNYSQATSSATVGSGFQQTQIQPVHV